MTSRIIAAIVAVFAVVLSLAAPVAVDAQTPTMTATVVSIGEVSISYSGFTIGGTYYAGSCSHASSHPASCTFANGMSTGAGTIGSCSSQQETINAAAWLGTTGGWPNVAVSQYRYTREVLYSDSACTTELAAVTYTYPSLPTLGVRDVTHDSATIYIEEPFSAHRISAWYYVPLTASVPRTTGNDCALEEVPGAPPFSASPTPRVTGLSAGTTYTYEIYDPNYAPCPQGDALMAVTFTTLEGEGDAPPGPPPPDPPSEVETKTTTDVSGGSVTLSWTNPGDPDIASYEYSIRQAGGPVGEWRTVPGSNADTTSVTIDLATGEAVAVNNATPPMVEWTIHLRARDVNGNAGGIFTTTVDAEAAAETVPALPLAGLAILALFLFMSGQWRRKGG